MVDECSNDGLIKYCKSKNITFKEYPKCLQESRQTVVNPVINRRKKIPPKSNDNVISDHETSTSCSEGEDDACYIKSVKNNNIQSADANQKKTATSSTSIPTVTTSSSTVTTSTIVSTTTPSPPPSTPMVTVAVDN